MTTPKPYKLTKTNDPALASDWRLEHGGKVWTVFYDRNLRLWTAFEIDGNGYQTGAAEYDVRKDTLVGSVTGTLWA